MKSPPADFTNRSEPDLDNYCEREFIGAYCEDIFSYKEFSRVE